MSTTYAITWRRHRRRAAVLAICCLKGGVSKSTTAIFLALAYSMLGLRVLVVDADRGASTTRRWHREARKNGIPLPFTLLFHPSDDLYEELSEQGAFDDFDLVIVDTGSQEEGIVRAVCEFADHVLFTVSPSKADTSVLGKTAVSAVGDGSDVLASVLITRPGSKQRAYRTQRELATEGYAVLDVFIKNWVAYQDAIGTCPTDLLGYDEVRVQLDRAATAALEATRQEVTL